MPTPFPLDEARTGELIQQFPTPFYLYDEAAIRRNARRLNAAFSWRPGFKEYFAVKAAPNPHLLKICREEGFGADCSSLPELELAQRVGMVGESIMFTSNNTPGYEYSRAKQLGAVLNLDDLTHVDYVERGGGRAARFGQLSLQPWLAPQGHGQPPSSASRRRPSTA